MINISYRLRLPHGSDTIPMYDFFVVLLSLVLASFGLLALCQALNAGDAVTTAAQSLWMLSTPLSTATYVASYRRRMGHAASIFDLLALRIDYNWRGLWLLGLAHAIPLAGLLRVLAVGYL